MKKQMVGLFLMNVIAFSLLAEDDLPSELQKKTHQRSKSAPGKIQITANPGNLRKRTAEKTGLNLAKKDLFSGDDRNFFDEEEPTVTHCCPFFIIASLFSADKLIALGFL